MNCNDLVQTHYYRDIKVNAPTPEQIAIEELQEDVARIDGDITRINGDITRINGDITRINGDITRINGEISNTNTRIDNLKDRYILFIGDSYAAETASYTGGTGASVGWPERAKDMIFNLKGYYITAVGGAGFGRDGAQSVITILTNWINSAEGQANKSKITDIVFGFGYNDCYGMWQSGNHEAYSQKCTNAMIACNNLIKANMPLAKPWLFSVGWGSNPYIREVADKVYNYTYPACEQIQWTYCQAHPVMYIPNRYADDRVHPNDEGMLRLGQYIANCLNGGKADYAVQIQGINPYVSTDISTCGFFQAVSSSEIQLMMTANLIYDGNSYTQQPDEKVWIASLHNAFTFGGYNVAESGTPFSRFQQPILLHTAGSKDSHTPMLVSFVAFEAGEKYGHMTYETAMVITNTSGSAVDYTKIACDYGKLSINPYWG